VKAQQVGAQHPFDHLLRYRVGELVETLGAAERRVGEVKDRAPLSEPAQMAGSGRQVVVLKENQRITARRACDGVGEVLVHRFVRVAPGIQRLVTDAIDAELVPEAVVGEPQQPVRDVVVVTAVDAGFDVEKVNRISEKRA